MARCREIAFRQQRLVVHGFLKIAKLSRRKHDEEGLKQHDGFPQAGIEVIVARIHIVPHALGVRAYPLDEIAREVTEVPIQVFHHFFKGADFMKELKAMREKHPVQQSAHAR